MEFGRSCDRDPFRGSIRTRGNEEEDGNPARDGERRSLPDSPPSLRRYEPDQVRRVTAPQDGAWMPLPAQRFLSPFGGTPLVNDPIGHPNGLSCQVRRSSRLPGSRRGVRRGLLRSHGQRSRRDHDRPHRAPNRRAYRRAVHPSGRLHPARPLARPCEEPTAHRRTHPDDRRGCRPHRWSGVVAG